MLEARNLWRSYEGVPAVRGVDLSVERGSAYGFIGPNGAGKSTTLRMLATLDLPDAGRIWIKGLDAATNPSAARKSLGFMPDPFELPADLRVEELLRFYAQAYRLPAGERRQRVERAIELTRIGERRRDKCTALSKGWRQRVLLAKTLVHDPDVLLLDEPASGLDPAARIEFREIVRALRDLGKTIVVSSHILTELADFCDSVGIIERGRMLVSGRIESILERLNPRDRLQFELVGGEQEALEALQQHPRVVQAGVARREGELVRLDAEVEGRAEPGLRADLVAALVDAGCRVAGLQAEREGLESLFLRVAGKLGREGDAPLDPDTMRALLGQPGNGNGGAGNGGATSANPEPQAAPQDGQGGAK